MNDAYTQNERDSAENEAASKLACLHARERDRSVYFSEVACLPGGKCLFLQDPGQERIPGWNTALIFVLFTYPAAKEIVSYLRRLFVSLNASLRSRRDPKGP